MTNTNTTPADEPRCVICGVPLGAFAPDPLDLSRCFSHGPSNLGAAAPRPVLVEEPPESCDESGAVVGANPDCGPCCDWMRSDARKVRP